MGRVAGALCALGLSALLCSCSLSRSYIRLAVPPPAPATSTGSGKVIVIDQVQDRRVFESDPRDPSIPSLKSGAAYQLDTEQLKSAIGRKRNRYGMAVGDYQLKPGQTVETITRVMIAATLRGMGYQVTDQAPADAADPVHLRVTIDRFWGWMTPYYWMAAIEAKVETRLVFSGPSGEKAVEVKGYGRNPIRRENAANWQITYDRAFRDYGKNLQKAMQNPGP
jgi:hypothetical protein